MRNAIVLAAGKGTRMHSDLTKVLHKVGDMPMAEVIVRNLKQCGAERIVTVVGYGREKVADVYFRTQVREYSRQVYGDYSQEAHEAAEKALTAFYSEVVELLKGEGWTLLNDYAHWHTCPELTKGDQYLYVHPDSISGEVNPADIDALEAKFKALTA